MKVLMLSRANLFDVPGGDTVQIVETAKALTKIGVNVNIQLANEAIDYNSYDLIHFFNIIRPNSISLHVKKSNLPFVISTIYVDYSEIEKNFRSTPIKLLYRIVGANGLEYLKTIGRAIFNNQGILDYSYLWHGHKKSVQQLLNSASLLLPNSNSEFKRLQKSYKFNNKYLSIPNSVSADFFEPAKEENTRNGVVCIARIEIIKNQLNLIKALKGTGIPLKIIGKPAPNHLHYYNECKNLADNNIQFLGQLPKNEIIEELNKAKAHVLPSFFETTGLSSLEAAAAGCNIVITDKGDTKEYFEDFAFYCTPNEPESILDAIQKALNSPVNPKLKQRIADNYQWKITAEKTLEAYTQVLKEKKA